MDFSAVISSEFLPGPHKYGPDPLLCCGTLLCATGRAAEAKSGAALPLRYLQMCRGLVAGSATTCCISLRKCLDLDVP